MTSTLATLRRTAGYAAATLEDLCGAANLVACGQLIADAIDRCAAASGAWAITLDREMLGFNAGPVRALALNRQSIWFATTLEIGRIPKWLVEHPQRKRVLYRSVPIPTRSFDVSTSKVRSLTKPLVGAFLSYVGEAASRRSGPSLFIKAHSPGVVSFLNELLGRQLPQPPGADANLTGEVLATDNDYLEGRTGTIVLDVHERSQKAREECIAAHGTRCSACGISFAETYGVLGKDFTEIHHLKPLSKAVRERKVDPKRDLVPVCPNCHRMLHREDPLLTPADLAARIAGNRSRHHS